MPKATDTILQGGSPPVEAGEEIPKTYRDSLGNEQPNDLDRLKELGLVETSRGASS